MSKNLVWRLYKFFNRKPLFRHEQRGQKSLTEQLISAQESLIQLEKRLRSDRWYKVRSVVLLFAAMYLPIELSQDGDNIVMLTKRYLDARLTRSIDKQARVNGIL